MSTQKLSVTCFTTASMSSMLLFPARPSAPRIPNPGPRTGVAAIDPVGGREDHGVVRQGLQTVVLLVVHRLVVAIERVDAEDELVRLGVVVVGRHLQDVPTLRAVHRNRDGVAVVVLAARDAWTSCRSRRTYPSRRCPCRRPCLTRHPSLLHRRHPAHRGRRRGQCGRRSRWRRPSRLGRPSQCHRRPRSHRPTPRYHPWRSRHPWPSGRPCW